MGQLKKIASGAVERILKELPQEEFYWLFWPGQHMTLLSIRRAAMIISRVRLIAALFAILTPLWIVVDVLLFPWPLCGELAAGRLVVSVLFGWMALTYPPSNNMRDAYHALLLMLTIPVAFFFFSQQLLLGEPFSGFGAAVSAGYAFLPFIMVAGLSVFPLTAWEGAVLSAPVLVAEVIAMTLHLEGMTWGAVYGAF